MPKPKTKPPQLRSDYITVRMGAALKAELSRRAEIMGMSISTYALFLISHRLEQILIPPADSGNAPQN